MSWQLLAITLKSYNALEPLWAIRVPLDDSFPHSTFTFFPIKIKATSHLLHHIIFNINFPYFSTKMMSFFLIKIPSTRWWRLKNSSGNNKFDEKFLINSYLFSWYQIRKYKFKYLWNVLFRYSSKIRKIIFKSLWFLMRRIKTYEGDFVLRSVNWFLKLRVRF